jgi:zinc protease
MTKKILSLILVLTFWLSQSVLAQSTSDEIKLPPIYKETLDNGLPVMIIEHHELPIVAFRLVTKSGGMDDPAGKAGLANFVADLLRQGTKTRSATQISEEIDFIGGSLGAGADYDYLNVNCQVLKKHLEKGLDLLAEVVLNPVFAEEEIERLRSKRIGEIKQAWDDPETVADLKFREFLYGNSPLAFSLDGSEESVKGITRQDIVNFHQTHFIPNNSILAIVGDVTKSEVLTKVKQKFGSWKKQSLPVRDFAQPEPVKGVQVLLVDKPDLTQTYINFGHLGIQRNHPDYFPVLVMNYILGGGGFSSRLMQEIRANRGLTYGISCYFDMYKQGGSYSVGTFTRNDSTLAAIQASLEEIKRIRKEKVSKKELEDAKNFYLGYFPSRFETPQQIATQVLNVEIYGLGDDYLKNYRKNVRNITVDDIQRVAQKYLDPENLKFVVVSNASDVKVKLESLGNVKTVAYAEGSNSSN